MLNKKIQLFDFSNTKGKSSFAGNSELPDCAIFRMRKSITVAYTVYVFQRTSLSCYYTPHGNRIENKKIFCTEDFLKLLRRFMK